MTKAAHKFLRDLERVTTLAGVFGGKPKKPETVLREIAPGVFASVPADDAPQTNVFGKFREALESLDRSDKIARDLGRDIRRKVR